MKKSFLIILACIISIIVFQAFTTSHEPQFKNLQILPKDISDHDLDSVMHHFSALIGRKMRFLPCRIMVQKNGILQAMINLKKILPVK